MLKKAAHIVTIELKFEELVVFRMFRNDICTILINLHIYIYIYKKKTPPIYDRVLHIAM
jgi:hypothetical protein